ncbi:hypothetical protein GCM10023205_42180 [Yinghuangia aomiensis]|uniref:Uncharacterized protein n=1 Tax=Yinghuangia aomiensis TaxID=676205 RepID=A0ABP9HIG5_9ACTN
MACREGPGRCCELAARALARERERHSLQLSAPRVLSSRPEYELNWTPLLARTVGTRAQREFAAFYEAGHVIAAREFEVPVLDAGIISDASSDLRGFVLSGGATVSLLGQLVQLAAGVNGLGLRGYAKLASTTPRRPGPPSGVPTAIASRPWNAPVNTVAVLADALALFLDTDNYHRCHTAIEGQPPITRVSNPAGQSQRIRRGPSPRQWSPCWF